MFIVPGFFSLWGVDTEVGTMAERLGVLAGCQAGLQKLLWCRYTRGWQQTAMPCPRLALVLYLSLRGTEPLSSRATFSLKTCPLLFPQQLVEKAHKPRAVPSYCR